TLSGCENHYGFARPRRTCIFPVFAPIGGRPHTLYIQRTHRAVHARTQRKTEYLPSTSRSWLVPSTSTPLPGSLSPKQHPYLLVRRLAATQTPLYRSVRVPRCGLHIFARHFNERTGTPRAKIAAR